MRVMQQQHARSVAAHCSSDSSTARHGRRLVLSVLPAIALPTAVSANEVEPFLKSSGARGFLADNEATMFALRKEKELQARDELDKERNAREEEARNNQTGLCATPYGVDVVGITEFIALVGALVGGVVARQRKLETERLNEQLRKINMQLRQQARAGTIYAPGLSYAPVQQTSIATKVEDGSSQEAAAPATAVATSPVALSSSEDVESPEQQACRDVLREGKRLLRSNQGSAALVRFEKALLMSQKVDDLLLQRRALRGLAASSRMQGNNQQAIKHLKAVLALSEKLKEYTGDADAYGSIADIYADMGDFEKAASYYDNYIQKMQEDGQAV